MKNRFWVILILGLLSAIGPFSIDMYLPSFPTMADSFDTTIARVSLSLSSFFVGISVGQLIYGPLLDRYGRKTPLYLGLILYLGASLCCAFAKDIDTLIIIRFFQALGSCAGMVAARALVRDLFPVSENAKIFSALMLVIAISPIVAPTAGGYISTAFGWQGIFYALVIISALVLIAVYFWLPEGAPPDTSKSLKPKPIIASFLAVAKVPKFFTYAISGAVASSGLYAYIAGSPLVFMQLYEVSKENYQWIFGFIALGLVSASQLNNLLLRKYSSEQISVASLGCQMFIGVVLVVGTYLNWLDLYSTIALIWGFLAMQGFAFPNTSALALEPFEKNAGTASALMGAIQLGIGAVVTAMIGVFSAKSALPMAAVMGVCAIISFIILILGRRFVLEEKI